MGLPQAAPAVKSRETEHRPLRVVREECHAGNVRREQADLVRRNAVLMCVVLVIVSCQKAPNSVENVAQYTSTRCSRDLQLPLIETGKKGERSGGAIMPHISVTSWSHLEHVEFALMPRDLASDMAWNVRSKLLYLVSPHVRETVTKAYSLGNP